MQSFSEKCQIACISFYLVQKKFLPINEKLAFIFAKMCLSCLKITKLLHSFEKLHEKAETMSPSDELFEHVFST